MISVNATRTYCTGGSSGQGDRLQRNGIVNNVITNIKMSSSQDENFELSELNSPSTSTFTRKVRTNNEREFLKAAFPGGDITHALIIQNVTPGSNLPPIVTKRKKKKRKRQSKISSPPTSEQNEPNDDSLQLNSLASYRSDNKSYKEKLKERFENVKKNANKSLQKVQKTDQIEDYSNNITENFQHWKRLRDTVSNTNQFFCGEIYSVTEDNAQLESHKPTMVEAKERAKSTDLLVSDQSDNDPSWILYALPELQNATVDLSEKQLLYQPSSFVLETVSKIETTEPRILSEEGLFVQKKIQIPTSHLSMIEQRLFATDDKKWFNCEGELITTQSPVSNKIHRPNLSDTNSLITSHIPPMLKYIEDCDSILVQPKILRINIFSIDFEHHPLFSAEHVYERKLLSLYKLYKQEETNSKIERIEKRLQVLRKLKINLQKSSNPSGDSNDDKTAENFTTKIKKLRNELFQEASKQRDTLKSLLQTWRNIKKIREENKYINTSIKLEIRKEKKPYELEKREWDENIEQMCSEVTAELISDNEFKMQKYRDDFEEWKRQKEEHSEKNVGKKPRKPNVNVDIEHIKQDVIIQFKESFKPPGEPILYFTIKYDNLNTNVENFQEKLRRTTVESTKLFVRLLCNNIEICKSKPFHLNEKFFHELNETFAVQIKNVPENITLEIYEQPDALLRRKICEIGLKLPSLNQPLGFVANEELFRKEEVLHYKHNGVGSGIKLKDITQAYSISDSNDNQMLNTCGSVTYKMMWEDVSQGAGYFNFDKLLNDTVFNLSTEIDGNQFNKWINNYEPDPQDPKNYLLYHYLKNRNNVDTNATSRQFRCNYVKPFCDAKERDENIRLKLLTLRDKNEPEFIGTVIPNRLREIPDNVLSAYNKRLMEEAQLLDDYDDAFDIKQAHGKRHLEQIYHKIFQLCRCAKNTLVYEDVVDEKLIPQIENTIHSAIMRFVNWFKSSTNISQPSMKTTRKEINDFAKLTSDVNVQVNVIAAVKLPIRSINKTSQRKLQHDINGDVQPFVIITHETSTFQTTVSNGPNPSWNETFTIPLKHNNTDYLSPNSMSGTIALNLFDQITTTNSNWLGSVEIPISALTYNNKIEGLFYVKIPPILLAYEYETDRLSSSNQSTYLSLNISLNPNIPKLTPSMDELQSNEPPYIRQHILYWNENCNHDYPNRKFSALAIDINGKTTCVTRYIKALEPPKLNNEGFDVTADQCAKYVSMIPFTTVNKFYQTVWLTSEQFLKFMIGSVVDHAILLTCYLQSLNLEAWLILGFGLPQGLTAYVLMRELAHDLGLPVHSIYDVTTAQKYNVTDHFCPVQKIFCVINEHNVWANIQRTDQIQITRFDFTRRSDWLPLFTNNITAPTNSVQLKLVYSGITHVRDIESYIDKKIRKKIMKSRKYYRTTWNHQLFSILKNFKPDNQVIDGRSFFEAELQKFTTHKVNGFVINLPYISICRIIEVLHSTQMFHKQETEFALAVKVCSYPNQVLNIWIFVACMYKL